MVDRLYALFRLKRQSIGSSQTPANPMPIESSQTANVSSQPTAKRNSSRWTTAVKIMANLGLLWSIGFLVWTLVLFSRVNQWNSVTESFVNDTLHIRVSFPTYAGRDETSRLHVVVENSGDQPFYNLRLSFISNGIARFKNGEALFSELLANTQRTATLEYTIDNANIIRDSEVILVAHLYYLTATLPVTNPVISATVQSPQSVLFNQPITISVNPDREYYLRTQKTVTNASAKLPTIIVSIISAIGALVSINIEGGPAKIIGWLVRAPASAEEKTKKTP